MSLATRKGTKPETIWGLPHQQADQQPTEAALRSELAERLFSLPHTTEAPSRISVPGARGAFLDDELADIGPDAAFFIGREFAHLHPAPDMSLHTHLPPDVAIEAIEAGWAEMHPLAVRGSVPPTRVMLFAPRDSEELETIWGLLTTAYHYATGHTTVSS